jgi:hypothetical protein
MDGYSSLKVLGKSCTVSPCRNLGRQDGFWPVVGRGWSQITELVQNLQWGKVWQACFWRRDRHASCWSRVEGLLCEHNWVTGQFQSVVRTKVLRPVSWLLLCPLVDGSNGKIKVKWGCSWVRDTSGFEAETTASWPLSWWTSLILDFPPLAWVPKPLKRQRMATKFVAVGESKWDFSYSDILMTHLMILTSIQKWANYGGESNLTEMTHVGVCFWVYFCLFWALSKEWIPVINYVEIVALTPTSQIFFLG